MGDLKDHPDGPELATRPHELHTHWDTGAVSTSGAWLPQKHMRDFAHARLAAVPWGPASNPLFSAH